MDTAGLGLSVRFIVETEIELSKAFAYVILEKYTTSLLRFVDTEWTRSQLGTASSKGGKNNGKTEELLYCIIEAIIKGEEKFVYLDRIMIPMDCKRKYSVFFTEIHHFEVC